MEIESLKSMFVKYYGEGSVRAFCGPARVNLIGEHTDHQGGYVLPAAISLRSMCLLRERDDGIIRLRASDIDTTVEAHISDLSKYKTIGWGAYQIGVAYVMQQKGYSVTGMDVLFDETVPHGSGLSSSAAIEVAMATAIATLSHEKISTPVDYVEIALIAQEAENQYVGMNCGIMDQFASSMGQKDSAIFLRCSDLIYRYVPVRFDQYGYRLVLCNTKKPRSLIESAYNQRRKECDEAYKSLEKALDIKCLADVTPQQFEDNKSIIANPVALKRARHVVYENARTISACELLERDDLVAFGRLMNESHESLRKDFEVTGIELDAMVDACKSQEGVIGARMTGAGFGGCAIALVETRHSDALIANAGEIYRKKTGYSPEFYYADITDGAGERRIEST
ncbi:MAG: galactokinase [Clostridiaceae bacterium]|nr:galactokinase [Clostridiaceae bacterium]